MRGWDRARARWEAGSLGAVGEPVGLVGRADGPELALHVARAGCDQLVLERAVRELEGQVLDRALHASLDQDFTSCLGDRDWGAVAAEGRAGEEPGASEVDDRVGRDRAADRLGLRNHGDGAGHDLGRRFAASRKREKRVDLGLEALHGIVLLAGDDHLLGNHRVLGGPVEFAGYQRLLACLHVDVAGYCHHCAARIIRRAVHQHELHVARGNELDAIDGQRLDGSDAARGRKRDAGRRRARHRVLGVGDLTGLGHGDGRGRARRSLLVEGCDSHASQGRSREAANQSYDRLLHVKFSNVRLVLVGTTFVPYP